jgi:hypothetical protein
MLNDTLFVVTYTTQGCLTCLPGATSAFLFLAYLNGSAISPAIYTRPYLDGNVTAPLVGNLYNGTFLTIYQVEGCYNCTN